MISLGNRRRRRRGTTAVEAAFVLPVFFLFLLGIIEFAHASMVQNVLQNACRSGARIGSTEGASTSEVIGEMYGMLAGAMDPNAATFMVKNAGIYDQGGAYPTQGAELEALPDMQLDNAEPRQLFVVRAKVNYSDIALVPMPFLEGVVLDAQAFMRHE